jgi:hypothetical protein
LPRSGRGNGIERCVGRSTDDAEYLALTRLQADAFITLDRGLAKSTEGIVPLASLDALR